jgi:DNA-binding NarL/FixJ family response regulator
MSVSAGPPIRVLVVHAHPLGAEALGAVLHQEDELDVVGTATSCNPAVTQAVERDVHVALIDFAVDNDGGAVVAAAIRERRSSVAGVMLVNSSSDRVTHAAVRAGCSAVVTKDRPLGDVVDAIRRVAGGEVLLGADELARLIPFKSGRDVGTDLSRRELEVLALLRDGHSTKEIAAALAVSSHTVRNHVQRILTKLHAASRLEAVAIAVRHGLIGR